MIGAGKGTSDVFVNTANPGEIATFAPVNIYCNSIATRAGGNIVTIHTTLYPSDYISNAGFRSMVGSCTITGQGKFKSDPIYSTANGTYTIQSTNFLDITGFPRGHYYQAETGGRAHGDNIIGGSGGWFLRQWFFGHQVPADRHMVFGMGTARLWHRLPGCGICQTQIGQRSPRPAPGRRQ